MSLIVLLPSPRSTVREAATKARQRLSEWTRVLGMPRRMLRTTELLELVLSLDVLCNHT